MTTTSSRRAQWKHHAFALVLVVASLGAGAVSAQDFTVGWNPRSGDVWVDTWLGDINRYGARYREPFIDELVRYHDAPRPLVVELLDRRRWTPGDVYYACALASILGRPCRYVVDMYEADRGQGWGAVAKRLGIKPGSAEFHRLKKGFVPTYDRWARPIDLDDELRREYPNRGKHHGGDAGAGDAASRKAGAGSDDRASGKQKAGSAQGHGPGQGKPSGKAAGGKGQGDKGQGKKGKGNGKG